MDFKNLKFEVTESELFEDTKKYLPQTIILIYLIIVFEWLRKQCVYTTIVFNRDLYKKSSI